MKISPSAFLLTVPIFAFISCAKPDLDFVNIRIGMTKDQVIEYLGKPTRMSVINNLEIFEYEAYDRVGALVINRRSQFVRFINGKVESFGNKGDFDSTKTPTSRVEIDKKVQDTSEKKNDVYAELIKLDDLRKRGILTDAEFEIQKKKLLAGN
jgi:hypothetical protein